ncbi:hypothetical protein P7K49_013092, partial [Saguinus oedipus]
VTGPDRGPAPVHPSALLPPESQTHTPGHSGHSCPPCRRSCPQQAPAVGVVQTLEAADDLPVDLEGDLPSVINTFFQDKHLVFQGSQVPCKVHDHGPRSLLRQEGQPGHRALGRLGSTAGGGGPSSACLYSARLPSSGSSRCISKRLFLPGARYSGTASSSTWSTAGGPPSLSARRTCQGAPQFEQGFKLATELQLVPLA